MSHEFQLQHDIELPATPEQVWAAIATGPGVDAWFMGHTEIEAREGGSTSFTMMGQTQTSTITAYQPGVRFGYRGSPGPDGAFMAFEYLIEAREGGSTALRLVQSGVLGGDNWETEYEAMQAGWPMYVQSLVAYLTYFPGRVATPVTGFYPDAGDPEQVWTVLGARFGLDAIVEGAPAQLDAPGLGQVDGVVDCVSLPHYFGVRTEDGLYRLLHSGVGRGSAVVIGHHIFADVDGEATEAAWQQWLSEVFAR